MEGRPLRLRPAFKDYLWGGRRLKTEFGMKCELDPVAEAWMVSCHPDGRSLIADGEWDGVPLADYLRQNGTRVLGTHGDPENFPVLIKLIDAEKKLSVQVHPDDEYARRVEGENGKTEMWYVMDCTPGATLLYGFSREISKEEFRRRIEENTLMEVVNRIPVHPGDTFFIEAGTLHAIGEGILIAEIQQNSNSTYRVSDYGRLGADGKPRPLHIEKALDVTNRKVSASPDRREESVVREGCTETVLARCDCFTVTAWDVNGTAPCRTVPESFHALLGVEGTAVLRWKDQEFSLNRGDCLFVPADCGDYLLQGQGRILCTTI